jgi:hypothetical protein
MCRTCLAASRLESQSRKRERLIREAIEFHIRGLREDGLEVPNCIALAREIEVAP